MDGLGRTKADGAPATKMPVKARANGLWGGPEPEEIRRLTYAGRRVLRLARLYASIKRVLGKDAPWAKGHGAALPQYSTRNVIAFAQDPDTAIRVLCLAPCELAQDLYVQFEGSDRDAVAREPALIVDVTHLREALWWLTSHCWQWIEATKHQYVLGVERLGAQLEGRLEEYRLSLGGAMRGVPAEIMTAATKIDSKYASVHLPGPADAAVATSSSSGSDEEPGAAKEEAPPRDRRAGKQQFTRMSAVDSSAAILDSGLEDLSPLRLWNIAMEKYSVLKECGRAHAKAKDDAAMRAELEAIAEAVWALKKLGASETQQKLEDFRQQQDGDRVVVRIGHEARPLNTFHPDWWTVSFTDLFFRGDFCEPKGIELRQLAKVLMQRADFVGWAKSKEFATACMNIALRRKQMWAVYRYCANNKQFETHLKPLLENISAPDFMKAALAAGDCDSIRTALRKKKIDVKVKDLLRSMDIALRGVEGTEAERELFRLKFGAMRIWNGCSCLFFTINPHDNKSPLLIKFCNTEHEHVEELSLEWLYDDHAAWKERVTKGNPLRLHELAVECPDAAARCVHWTFENTIRYLFNCGPPANTKPKKQHMDTVPARCEPGTFAFISGYLGIVEPQMRFTEHLHMILQLLGFSHPREFFRSGEFVEMFRRVWQHFASFCFTSPEAFASSFGSAAAMDAIRQAPTMPVKGKQAVHLGAARAAECEQAQLAARGGRPEGDAHCLPFTPWTPSAFKDSSLNIILKSVSCCLLVSTGMYIPWALESLVFVCEWLGYLWPMRIVPTVQAIGRKWQSKNSIAVATRTATTHAGRKLATRVGGKKLASVACTIGTGVR
jgi:hypothetical protein